MTSAVTSHQEGCDAKLKGCYAEPRCDGLNLHIGRYWDSSSHIKVRERLQSI